MKKVFFAFLTLAILYFAGMAARISMVQSFANRIQIGMPFEDLGDFSKRPINIITIDASDIYKNLKDPYEHDYQYKVGEALEIIYGSKYMIIRTDPFDKVKEVFLMDEDMYQFN